MRCVSKSSGSAPLDGGGGGASVSPKPPLARVRARVRVRVRVNLGSDAAEEGALPRQRPLG